MNSDQKELQKLKGVGIVLSHRLVEAGYDSFAKIAAAGEDGLKKIQGINPRAVRSIIAQASEMTGEMTEDAKKSKAEKIGELKQRAACLRCHVQELALSVRDRFAGKAADRAGKKVEQEFVKVISTLETLEGNLETRIKKAAKGLAKAEKRLAGLTSSSLKGVGEGLKKARKSLKNVYA